jgi:flagellar M-ring protein FliF
VTNYEVDKTVRVTRDATGSVKRLNAAVVVNNRSTTDAKGKTTSQPLAQEELDKLTALVRESVGFNQERGDSVKVINAPFRREVPVEVSVPLWQQPETIDLVRSLAVPGALGVVALLVVFGLLRPALKAVQAPASPRGQKLDAVVQDDLSLPDGSSPNTPVLEAPRASAQLEQARLLAQQNPAAVAGIVRGWVNGGQAA